MMHRTTVIAAILFVVASTSASAQEWIEFASREDGFTCNFPGQPDDQPETTFRSQFGADLPGAPLQRQVWPAAQMRERDALTVAVHGTTCEASAHRIPDGSRTLAAIYMHENKLYILEGTVPEGYPEPGIFQQSMGWIDENGKPFRYRSLYHNGFPAPPR